MDTIWFGVRLAFGLAIGFAVLIVLVRLTFKVRAFIATVRFTRAGCVYQPSEAPGAPSGWLIRDVANDDWVLWDERNRRALRAPDGAPANVPWSVSTESLNEFLILARREREHWSKSAHTAQS